MRRANVSLVGVLALCLGCGGQKSPNPIGQPVNAPSQVSANVKIDFGNLKKNTYTNKYFRFEVTKPGPWVAQSDETRIELMKQGLMAVSGGDQQLAAALKASEVNTLNMFMFSKFEIGTPGKSNPSIMGVAENIKATPGIKKGKDYLWHAKKLLTKGSMKTTLGKEYPREIGQKTFDVLELEMSVLKKIHQKYMVMVKGGYAFTIILSYESEAELKEIEDILETVKFN